jgi:hypothetical protein
MAARRAQKSVSRKQHLALASTVIGVGLLVMAFILDSNVADDRCAGIGSTRAAGLFAALSGLALIAGAVWLGEVTIATDLFRRWSGVLLALGILLLFLLGVFALLFSLVELMGNWCAD